jgi:ferredoxin-NADP reductase
VDTAQAADSATETESRRLRVHRATHAAEGVITLDLVDPDGRELAPWAPGAHLELSLPSGLRRHYSLCGPPDDRLTYTVAVLRVADSKGGSREIHDTGLVGQVLEVRGPRNNFALTPADRYLFLAGGIGITPIVAMARDVRGTAADWRLVYGGRSRPSMAFHDELNALDAVRVELVPEDERGFPDFKAAISTVTSGTAIYACGPPPMLQAVEDLCRDLGHSDTLHIERFTGRGDGPAMPGDGSTGFEVELRRSGIVLDVPDDRTLIDVVRDVVPNVAYSCLEGICGSCETRVLEGEPEHHDEVLSDDERAAGDVMMICVGRSCSPRLVLDL